MFFIDEKTKNHSFNWSILKIVLPNTFQYLLFCMKSYPESWKYVSYSVRVVWKVRKKLECTLFFERNHLYYSTSSPVKLTHFLQQCCIVKPFRFTGLVQSDKIDICPHSNPHWDNIIWTSAIFHILFRGRKIWKLKWMLNKLEQ